MPADTFEREVALTADAETCWKTVTDIRRIVDWVEILDNVEEHEHLGTYTAVLEDRIGPFALRADLDIVLRDVEEGRSLSLTAEGRDTQVDSRIFVEGRLLLDPSDEGVRLHVKGRYEVTGRVATFGSSMIRSKADQIIAGFLVGVTGELGS